MIANDKPPVSPFPAALLLMLLSFVSTYATAAKLHELQVFRQYNVIFDADPNYYLRVFSSGPLLFDYRHPALPVFAYAPIALLAKVFGMLGAGNGSPEFRESLALLVASMLAAGRTLVLFALFRRVVERLPSVVLLCIADMFAASMLIIASLPESYAFSSASLAVMFWLAVGGGPSGPWARVATWLAVATVSIGVTITNVIPLAVLAAASFLRQRYRFIRRAALVGALIGAAVMLNSAIVGASAWFFSYRPFMPEKLVAPGYLHPPSPAEASALGWALGHTFLAPPPGTAEVWTPPGPKPKFDFMFSYEPPFRHRWASLWRAVVTVALLAMGAVGLAKHRKWRRILVAAVLIVAANVLIHLFYGRHYYLYSPHWEPALIVVIAGVRLLAGRLGDALLAGFALATVASTCQVLYSLFERLGSS